MTIIRVLEKTEHSRLLISTCLTVQYNEEIDRFFLVDQGGFVLTEDEFNSLAKEMALTYGQYNVDIAEWNEQRTKELNPPEYKRTGYIYLLSSSSGLHKIGLSIDPARRLKTIRSKKPQEYINMIHHFPADDIDLAESALHHRFRDKCHHSEWFNLDPNDIAFICSITSYQEGQFNNELSN